METLAVKYRPSIFSDVTEQSVISEILMNQIKTGNVRNAYLFSGASGTGKTTSARIFAHELNDSEDNNMITELDAASHGSVEDFRRIIEDSKFKPIGNKYRIFIIDECHSASNAAWQSALKAIEEPTPTSIFIFCTTDPQKIPSTIISRVQQFNFNKISHNGIINRLKYIIESENNDGNNYTYDDDAISYIAKLADGGMRKAITMLEKVLSLSNHVTMSTVVDALGTVDYSIMFDFTDALCKMDKKRALSIIDSIHKNGNDLKQFIKLYTSFVLDLCKYRIFDKDFDFLQIPSTFSNRFSAYTNSDYSFFNDLLNEMINLNNTIKWDSMPKPIIESTIIILCSEA